jgi:uncharacterized protein YdeI (YjbR/CyaY-like superfamily)
LNNMTAKQEKMLVFSSQEMWRAWLEEHHATEQEAWLLHYKKKASQLNLSYEEAVEEALCFGWIDGLLRRMDNERFTLRYSPRKSRSVWSIWNIQRVERLTKEGRMTEAGLAKVAEAKQNGEWQAAIDREVIDNLPSELVQELKKNRVMSAFMKMPPSHRKQYLYWLNSAKRPETRGKRLQAIVEMVKDKKR